MYPRKNCTSVACIAASLLAAAANAQSDKASLAPPVANQNEAKTDAGPDRSIAEEPRIHLRGAAWYTRLDGNMSVGRPIPGTTEDIDLIDTLNLDPSNLEGMASVTIDLGKEQRIHISAGYSGHFNYDGTSDPLNISFDNLHFTGIVDSKAKFDIAEFGLNFDVARPGPVTISLGTSSRVFFFDGSVTGTATNPDTGVTAVQTSSASVTAPIPGLSASLRWDITDQVYLRGAGQGVWLGNYGDFFDAEAELGYDFSPNLGVFGGYRWMQAEADVNDVHFDVTIQGPYAGLEVRF